MAVNKTINKRTNTHGAMRNCIEYVLRQDKTGELLTYVTGPYCHDEINYDLVYRTFLEEKKMWNKDSGRMYAHNIISWHKDEQITLEQAFEFGKEFAEKWFSGFQTLVAVHKDTIPNVGYICADYWGNPVYALFNESEKIRYDLDYEYFNGCTDDCMRYGILCSYCGNCYRSAG